MTGEKNMAESNTALVNQGSTAADRPVQRETAFIEIIAAAVNNPAIIANVDALSKLLDMQERMQAREAERLYNDALSRIQVECPQIQKAGEILNKTGKLISRYILNEDLDVVLRPLMHDNGFAFQLSEVVDGPALSANMRVFAGTVKHRSGHSVTLYKRMPFDKSDYRTEAQSESSTTTLARRQLLRMHFNIVGKGEDNDGADTALITDDQAKDIDTLLSEVKGDKASFLRFMGVNRIEDILAADYKKAINALEAKRRSQK
jgi:hypothetical protein